MIIFNSAGGMTFHTRGRDGLNEATLTDVDHAPARMYEHRYDAILLLEGGADINPGLYGQPMTHTYGVHTLRDLREIYLWTLARRFNIPILGICRGHQLMAALAGGQLHQDIRECLNVRHGGRHRIHIEAEMEKSGEDALAPLARSFYTMMLESNPEPFNALLASDTHLQGETSVNSMHHQAISVVPAEGRVVATSLDGVIEAVVYPYGLGVQWHPEVMGHERMAQWVWETFRKVDPDADSGAGDRNSGIITLGA